jgi:hypothetical protein
VDSIHVAEGLKGTPKRIATNQLGIVAAGSKRSKFIQTNIVNPTLNSKF